MNRDVFLSILAMDSYDNELDAGVRGLPDIGFIGTAQLRQRPLPTGSSQAGFYATAYDWEGHTVISYRGTDMASALSTV